MPTYLVELEDGRQLEVEADSQPSESDILAYLQPEPQDSGQGYLSSALSSVGRGVTSGVTGPIGGLGYLLPDVLGGQALVDTAESMEEGVRGALPVNPIYEDTFGMKAFNALGQAGSMILTGGAGGLTGKVLSGGAKMGIRKGAERAALGSGFLSGSQEGGRAAERYGMEGIDAYLRALGGGATEFVTEKFSPFGLATETGAARRLLGEGLQRGAGAAVKDIASEGVEEMAANTGGNILNKIFAPEGVETPGVLEGNLEAGALGAIGGSLFAGVNAATGAYDSDKAAVEAEFPSSTPVAQDGISLEESRANFAAGGSPVIAPDGTVRYAPPEKKTTIPNDGFVRPDGTGRTTVDAAIQQADALLAVAAGNPDASQTVAAAKAAWAPVIQQALTTPAATPEQQEPSEVEQRLSALLQSGQITPDGAALLRETIAGARQESPQVELPGATELKLDALLRSPTLEESSTVQPVAEESTAPPVATPQVTPPTELIQQAAAVNVGTQPASVVAADVSNLTEVRQELDSSRDLSKPEQMTPAERGSAIDADFVNWGSFKTRKAAQETLDERLKNIPDTSPMHGVAAEYGLTVKDLYGVGKGKFRSGGVGWGIGRTPRHEIAVGMQQKLPVSAAAVDAYNIKLPKGYERQGELYIFKPQTAATTQEAAPVRGSDEGGSKGDSTNAERDYQTVTTTATNSIKSENPSRVDSASMRQLREDNARDKVTGWSDADYAAAEAFYGGDKAAITGLSKIKQARIVRAEAAPVEQEMAERRDKNKQAAANDRAAQEVRDAEEQKGYDRLREKGVLSVAEPPTYELTQEKNAALAKKFGLPTEAGVYVNAEAQIKSALAKIATNSALPWMTRAVARVLQRISFKGVDLRIEADGRRNFAGYYLNDEGITEIALNLRQVARGQVDVIGTFLHEALHHATLAKVRDPQNTVENEAVESLNKLVQRVRSYAGLNENRKFSYETSNVEEFISALFTRPDFQAFLAQMPDETAPKTAAGKLRSILSEIFRTIARLVSGKEVARGSTLEQAMTASLALFETPQRTIETGPLDSLGEALDAQSNEPSPGGLSEAETTKEVFSLPLPEFIEFLERANTDRLRALAQSRHLPGKASRKKLIEELRREYTMDRREEWKFRQIDKMTGWSDSPPAATPRAEGGALASAPRSTDLDAEYMQSNDIRFSQVDDSYDDQAPQGDEANVSARKAASEALRAQDGAIVSVGVSKADATNALTALQGVVPGIERAWTGTRAEFLADEALGRAYPNVLKSLLSATGDRLEGAFNAGRAFLFTDQAGVFEGDERVAKRDGITPAQAAAQRVLTHEALVHRGFYALDPNERAALFRWGMQNIYEDEMDTMGAQRGMPDWRTDLKEREVLMEEIIAKRAERMKSPPTTGPLKALWDILTAIWHRITGQTKEPTIKDIRDVARILYTSLVLAESRTQTRDGMPIEVRESVHTEPSPGGLNEARIKAFDAIREARRDAEDNLDDDRAEIRRHINVMESEDGQPDGVQKRFFVFYRGNTASVDFDSKFGFIIDHLNNGKFRITNDVHTGEKYIWSSFAEALDDAQQQMIEDWENQQVDRQFGQWERGKDEAFTILKAFLPPPGIETARTDERAFVGSGGIDTSGSIYGEFRPENAEDGPYWKIRISDHDKQSHLHRLADEVFIVPKNWNPKAVEEALREAYVWLEKKVKSQTSQAAALNDRKGQSPADAMSKSGSLETPSSQSQVNPSFAPPRAEGGVRESRRPTFTNPLDSTLSQAAQRIREMRDGPAVNAVDLKQAYRNAVLGKSSAMVSLDELYAAAKALNPSITEKEFGAQVQSLYDDNGAYVEPAESPAVMQAAADKYNVRSSQGIPANYVMIVEPVMASQRVGKIDGFTLDEDVARDLGNAVDAAYNASGNIKNSEQRQLKGAKVFTFAEQQYKARKEAARKIIAALRAENVPLNQIPEALNSRPLIKQLGLGLDMLQIIMAHLIKMGAGKAAKGVWQTIGKESGTIQGTRGLIITDDEFRDLFLVEGLLDEKEKKDQAIVNQNIGSNVNDAAVNGMDAEARPEASDESAAMAFDEVMRVGEESLTPERKTWWQEMKSIVAKLGAIVSFRAKNAARGDVKASLAGTTPQGWLEQLAKMSPADIAAEEKQLTARFDLLAKKFLGLEKAKAGTPAKKKDGGEKQRAKMVANIAAQLNVPVDTAAAIAALTPESGQLKAQFENSIVSALVGKVQSALTPKTPPSKNLNSVIRQITRILADNLNLPDNTSGKESLGERALDAFARVKTNEQMIREVWEKSREQIRAMLTKKATEGLEGITEEELAAIENQIDTQLDSLLSEVPERMWARGQSYGVIRDALEEAGLDTNQKILADTEAAKKAVLAKLNEAVAKIGNVDPARWQADQSYIIAAFNALIADMKASQAKSQARRLADRRVSLLSAADKKTFDHLMNEARRRSSDKVPFAPEDVSWRDMFSTSPQSQEQKVKEMLEFIKNEPALAALTADEAKQLADIFAKEWAKKRQDLLEAKAAALLKKNLATAKGEKAMKDSIPAFIQAINRGELTNGALVAEIADKFGFTKLTDAEVAQLEKLSKELQEPNLPLHQRVEKQDAIAKIITAKTRMTLAEMLSAWWVSAVLFGPRTVLTIAAAFQNGGFEVFGHAISTMIRYALGPKAAEGRQAAFDTITEYFSSWPMAFRNAWQYVMTGDKRLLTNADQSYQQMFEPGARNALSIGERMAMNKNPVVAKLGRFMFFLEKLLTALDLFNSTTTRRGLIPVSYLLNQQMYDRAKVASLLDVENYRKQMRALYWGNKEPDTARERAVLDRAALNAAEDAIREFGNTLDDAAYGGGQAAMTLKPEGLGNMLYKGVRTIGNLATKGAEKLREGADQLRGDLGEDASIIETKTRRAFALLAEILAHQLINLGGFRFARFAGNKLNQSIGFIPLVGLGRLTEKGYQGQIKRQSIFRNQAIAMGLMVWFYGMLKGLADDPDDEDRWWDWEGSWDGLTPDEKSQNYAAGRQPNTFRIKGVGSFNYANWPVSSLFAAGGMMADRIKYQPKRWKESSPVDVAAAGIIAAATTTFDTAALSQLSEIFGGSVHSRDPVAAGLNRMSRVFGNYAGGFIPRVFKDMDHWVSSGEINTYQGWERFGKEIPVYRRYVGAPMLDIFAKPVVVSRAPWSREFKPEVTEPEYKILGKLNSEGVWLTPANPDNRRVGKGRRSREMTDAEKNRYISLVGDGYRKTILRYGDRLVKMTPEDAKSFLGKETAKVRDKAEKAAVRKTP